MSAAPWLAAPVLCGQLRPSPLRRPALPLARLQHGAVQLRRGGRVEHRQHDGRQRQRQLHRHVAHLAVHLRRRSKVGWGGWADTRGRRGGGAIGRKSIFAAAAARPPPGLPSCVQAAPPPRLRHAVVLQAGHQLHQDQGQQDGHLLQAVGAQACGRAPAARSGQPRARAGGRGVRAQHSWSKAVPWRGLPCPPTNPAPPADPPAPGPRSAAAPARRCGSPCSGSAAAGGGPAARAAQTAPR